MSIARATLSARQVGKLRYECDFIFRGSDDQIVVQEVHTMETSGLPDAIQWIEDRILSAPTIFNKAGAVRLRRGSKVVWLKSLGGLSAGGATIPSTEKK